MNENEAPGWVWWCGLMGLVCGICAILSIHTPVSNAFFGFTVVFFMLVLLWCMGDLARQMIEAVRRHQKPTDTETWDYSYLFINDGESVVGDDWPETVDFRPGESEEEDSD